MCYLADKWYTDNITKEVVETEWDKFYDYYDDVDGLFHEYIFRYPPLHIEYRCI